MPRSTDPNYKVALVLDWDKDKPSPPTFFFKIPTLRDERELGQIYEEIKAAGTVAGELNAMSQPLQDRLVGWKNMLDPVDGSPMEFDSNDTTAIESLLDSDECLELARKLLASGRLSSEEKKSSESQASSDMESSASSVPVVVSDAPTSDGL